MNDSFQLKLKNEKVLLVAVLFVVLIKSLFLLTHHLQEDAFITWRVAQNILDYGVMGFNGDVKISASTTYLYVMVSWLFNVIFGKEHFIDPLLTFNSLLFTLGCYFLSKLLLKNIGQQVVFIFLLGITPPGIKISILGMEYGLLFFLEMLFLYYGFFKRKQWTLWVLPTLILFTRLDSILFLGVVFLVDWFKTKRFNWRFFMGGFIGLILLFSFNWLYFHELINNTIIAKRTAYAHAYSWWQLRTFFLWNIGNFWGMIKVPGHFNPFTYGLLIFEITSFIVLIRQKETRNYFLIIIFAFGWLQQIVFLSQRAYFDWYYWIPQILLFVPILILMLEQKRKVWWIPFIVFYTIPMVAYQTVHSIATGNGEWNYRRSIGIYLDHHEPDKNQWIFLEPAGFIPYYSHLKTIDYVGLVDKGVQKYLENDPQHFVYDVAKNRKPKYILAFDDLYKSADGSYFQTHYKLLRKFRIDEFLSSPNPVLSRIYHLKPSGTNYNLYERVN